MIHTNVKHTSYSTKNGYVWRKMYLKEHLSVSVQTRDEVEAATGWVGVMGDGSMWVLFAGQRMAYSVMQGKLKNTVHSVMVQHSLVSSRRG